MKRLSNTASFAVRRGAVLASLAVFLVASPLLAPRAQSQELPARIKTAGKLIIATNPNYAPITYKTTTTNELTGLDIDLGKALGEELGIAVEWQEIAFAQMLPSLQTGRVDLILAGMADKPARREAADFVNYMSSGAQFYTITAFKDQIRTVEDLCGKSVGASRSTTWPADMEAWSKENCVAKGKPPITVVGTEGSVDARTQLKTQRLQAAVQGNETLPYFQTLEPNTYIGLGKPFTSVLAGIAVAKTPEGAQLREAVKAALERLRAKGTYGKIFARYGLQDNALPAITVNQGT